eukprot:scaffold67845_cov21-Tisochrysis_lutea.AAC.1
MLRPPGPGCQVPIPARGPRSCPDCYRCRCRWGPHYQQVAYQRSHHPHHREERARQGLDQGEYSHLE